MNLWLVFLTGLTTGGVTCAAMQGGLLASIIASLKKEDSKPGFGQDDWAPVAAFLSAKLVSHLILGFLLGWLGSQVEFSPPLRLFFQLLAALFMLATAANLLDLHPLFRHVVIRPPRFAYRLIKSSSRNLFGPAVFGFLTVLVPCGVTQTMAVVAIATGSPLQGALIMGSFVLGTIPLFALIGLATARLSETWALAFRRLAASLLVIMSLYGVNGILTSLDSPYAPTRILAVLRTPLDTPAAPLVDGVQPVKLSIENSGYSPRYFRVRAGSPVALTIEAGRVYSCALAFTFPEFGIVNNFAAGETRTFTFTPAKKGRYTYTCSMGMYSGVMEVI